MTETREHIELAILSCIAMTGGPAIDSLLRAGADRTWFTTGPRRDLVTACMTLHEEARPCDGPSAMMRDPGLDGIVATAMDTPATMAHLEHYLEQLAGLVMVARSEQAMEMGVTRLAGTPPEDAGDALGAIIESLNIIASGQSKRDVPIGDVAESVIKEWQEPENKMRHIAWPLDTITRSFGRVEDEVVWIIAQPSVGKTAFAVQWAIEVARMGIGVSIASLESNSKKIAARMIAYLAKIDTRTMRNYTANHDAIQDAQAAAAFLKRLPVRVTDSGMTLDQVYAWGLAEARRGQRLLIVDNTRHIRQVGNQQRNEWTGRISGRMKQLRDDSGVPVVVLHHANKPADGQKDDASWSQDIRRDADIMAFLRIDEKRTVPPGPDGSKGRCCVGFDMEKARDGIKGFRVVMEFFGNRQAFEGWQ